MRIKFPNSNKYFPNDTYKIFSRVSATSNFNFYFLFNAPVVIGRNLPEKIRINGEIEKFKWDQNFLNNIEKRKDNLFEFLEKDGYKCAKFNGKCNWRLIIGLGASHPQETSMTLHHIYGIPYIPGSAIKGVTRHYAVLKFAEKDIKNDEKFEDAVKRVSQNLENGKELNIEVEFKEENKNEKIKFSELIEIFGTQNQKGKVIFMDAYPINKVNLKIDIMNPHYPEYYSQGKPPADWQNPRPIKFLTVENTDFKFYLFSKSEELLEKAKILLKGALKEEGIGAKTSLGYGIFNYTEE